MFCGLSKPAGMSRKKRLRDAGPNTKDSESTGKLATALKRASAAKSPKPILKKLKESFCGCGQPKKTGVMRPPNACAEKKNRTTPNSLLCARPKSVRQDAVPTKNENISRSRPTGARR